MRARAQAVIDTCRAIATFSETPDAITRTYLAPATREVHGLLRSWMDRLKIESWIDAVGNLRGLRRSGKAGSARLPPRLLIGSHIDTVPNAGAFDGVLGVVMALSLVEALDDHALDYDIEVVAFSEEEGVRFRTPFIGSRALTGDVDAALLSEKDGDSTTLAEAIAAFSLDPAAMDSAVMDPSTFAFVEFHIEQGPVLDNLNQGLGIVEAIAGQSRFALTFHGKANHAGTTPMRLRQDALAGAAEWMVEVERLALATDGLVATIGRIDAAPGVANVIPEDAIVSLDVRHADDSVRQEAVQNLLSDAYRITARRGLSLGAIRHFDQPATAMNSGLTSALEAAAMASGTAPHRMVSGAGHDALVIARKVPAAILFVRSPGGISHHPDENVLIEDIEAALATGLYFLKHLDPLAITPRLR